MLDYTIEQNRTAQITSKQILYIGLVKTSSRIKATIDIDVFNFMITAQ